jgi:hypothetical protein
MSSDHIGAFQADGFGLTPELTAKTAGRRFTARPSRFPHVKGPAARGEAVALLPRESTRSAVPTRHSGALGAASRSYGAKRKDSTPAARSISAISESPRGHTALALVVVSLAILFRPKPHAASRAEYTEITNFTDSAVQPAGRYRNRMECPSRYGTAADAPVLDTNGDCLFGMDRSKSRLGTMQQQAQVVLPDFESLAKLALVALLQEEHS